jgi:hypothetical protein
LDQKLQLKYGSGSTLLIENGSNTDPDPQPWLRLSFPVR